MKKIFAILISAFLIVSFLLPSVVSWSGWADGWTISDSHSGNSTGYLYGNWSFSEHINGSTLDELWTEANDTHWDVEDDSSWWVGEYTYAINTTGINNSFAILNNSGMNRSQGFGWAHLDDAELDAVLPYIIFAYNTSQDYDLIMWSTNEMWVLHWNGTNMTDMFTGAPVVNPSTDATDVSDQWVQEGVYLNDEGNYYKYIFNGLSGTIRFKWWGGGALNEPVGWATQYHHDSLKYDTCRSQGIGIWNYNQVETTVQWDLMNIWQLNYTVNESAWCNISDHNESRPHMDYPVIDLGDWTEEILSYFNATAEGNMSADLMRSIMKDNLTNPMNMESRLFKLASPDTYQQNDTVYYYSCLIDNFTAIDPEALYDEYLHLHVQMCPEYEVDTGEYVDIIIAIDVDNDYAWNPNDRIYWAYADDAYDVTKIAYNGDGDAIPTTFDANIWQSDQSAVGNIHRYNKQINYVVNIPLADLIKTGSKPLNVSDIFGLSIMTTVAGTAAFEYPCIWQNWNETAGEPFWNEDDQMYTDAILYFFNGSGEQEEVPNSTSIGRWGEGEITDIGGSFNESGTISYNMSINVSFDNTSSSPGAEYAYINVSILVNNTGAGNLSEIYLNTTWWNCSCSDLNMTFIDSNQDISNFTWFNDSCYLVIHNTSIEPLTPGNTWEIWYTVNVTNCSGADTAIEYVNVTGNATELASDVTSTDVPRFVWGAIASSVCVKFTTINDLGITANTVLAIMGIVIIISSILLLIGLLGKYNII